MTGQLLLTAALMGLAGSPHCVAMCAAGCGAAARACAGPRPSVSLAWMMLGRALAYAVAGAVAAAGVGSVRALADVVVWFRPIWTMAQVAAVLLGLSLLWLGRQPRWMDELGVRVQRRLTALFSGRLSGARPELRLMLAGAMMVGLPCGLLYSALVVAALASSATEGAVVMLAFSAGGALALWGVPLAWWRMQQGATKSSTLASTALAVRLAGALLLVASAWALGHGVWRPVLEWCGLA